MSDAAKAGANQAIHSLVTLVASSGVTAAIDRLAGGFSPIWVVVLVAAIHIGFTYLNNWLKMKGINVPFLSQLENYIDSHLNPWPEATPNG